MILLIAAVAAAGFFLHRKSYVYPYIWSEKAPGKMTFEKAELYCGSLTENDESGWRLPELSEIRTLSDKCEEEENGDYCDFTDSCEWDNCENEFCGRCVKYEETVSAGSFWTKTQKIGGRISVWTIGTGDDSEFGALPEEQHDVRCVRIQ